MTTEALKSLSITNLDAIPRVPNTSGEGAAGILRDIGDFFAPSASMAAGSTYRVVRIPTYAKVKSVKFQSGAQGAGKFQVSAYYSDATNDGTPPDKQGLVVPTNGAGFFSGDIDCASAVLPTDVLGKNSAVWTTAKINTPLWSALGLTTDPGGYFDVVCVVHTTDITTGTGNVCVEVSYVI